MELIEKEKFREILVGMLIGSEIHEDGTGKKENWNAQLAEIINILDEQPTMDSAELVKDNKDLEDDEDSEEKIDIDVNGWRGKWFTNYLEARHFSNSVWGNVQHYKDLNGEEKWYVVYQV